MNHQKVEATPRGLIVAAALGLTACTYGSIEDEKEGSSEGSFSGALIDARLSADVYTWSCQDPDTQEMYQGAFGQKIKLEYAPGGIEALELPGVGECVAGLNMSPDDAGPNAIDIPGVAFDPQWESDVDDGTLTKRSIGFYYGDAFPNVRTCQSTDEVMAGGVTLVDAGSLTDATTPAPNDAPTVEFSTAGTSIEFGDTVSMEWGSHLWGEVFVQVRREKERVAWESVTCNVTGLGGFTVDEMVWDMMDERVQVDQNNLYVGFQTVDRQTVSGSDVQVVTRAIAVAVVED